jgi:hypothetical protein
MYNTTFEGGLGYEGKVTLTLKSNGRVLETRTYKNRGTSKLFEFLGYCLMDEFETVKGLLPTKIRLLYNTEVASSDTYSADPTSVAIRTAPQERIQAPTFINDSAKAQVKVIYNFEVPKEAIFGEGEQITQRQFNQIALYGAKIEDPTEFSAFYFLVNEKGDSISYDAKDWSATTVLLIDWELILSNKNIETQNNREEEVV